MEEHIINPHKPTSAKVALIHGIYMGIAQIALSLLLYLLGLNQESFAQYISYALMIALTTVFVLLWRNKYNDGFISYSSAFGNGFLTILFGAILSGIYTYIFFEFIAPDELVQMLEKVENDMYDKGMAENEVEMAMSWTRAMMSTWSMPLWVIGGSAFWGAIISAILAIFIKKEPKEFA